MADVFISYSRADSRMALRIDHLFRQEGWSTWIDHAIAPGDDFRPEIEREIDAAACVVVLWTPEAVASSWVCREALRALEQRKLVEAEVSPGLASQADLSEARVERSPPVLIGEDVHVDPRRESLLTQMASVGRLARPRDRWNATLLVHNWRESAPSYPVIGWEWLRAGEAPPRICRRERWVEGSSAEYRTAIGSYWQFGYEGAQVAIGYLTITEAYHEVTLPTRDKPHRPPTKPFTITFSEGGVAAEYVSGYNLPTGGVALDPDQQVGADDIETQCREYLSAMPDTDSYLVFVSNDTDDPFKYDVAVELLAHPTVWCRLQPQKRTRDRRKLERTIAKLRGLGWIPPAEGPTEGGPVRGRRLTSWRYDAGPVAGVNCADLAALILETFLAVYGAPPAGFTHGSTTDTDVSE
jgi:TIR domain-containing protein